MSINFGPKLKIKSSFDIVQGSTKQTQFYVDGSQMFKVVELSNTHMAGLNINNETRHFLQRLDRFERKKASRLHGEVNKGRSTLENQRGVNHLLNKKANATSLDKIKTLRNTEKILLG